MRSVTSGLLGLLGLCVAGCYGTGTTTFPAGLEVWEPNTATLPAATATDMFPEQIVYAETHWTVPGTTQRVLSVHARAYVQAPIATVFAAVRDPQVGRDPVDSQGFRVEAYDTEPMYTWSYRTFVHVQNVITLDWNVAWRHGVVSGTAAAPTLTATRWQKIAGTTAIPTLEGSLVLQPVSGHPEVTEVQYQYHLDAPLSSYNSLEIYLDAVYARLLARSHARALDPDDCTDCATPPAGY